MNKYDPAKIEKKWPSSAKATGDKKATAGRQSYDFETIEAKWQKKWEKSNYAKGVDFDKKPKHYHLIEFPYPSGAGLHVGHCMGYGASDAYCRMKRLQGFNVMFPIGWDAFGLPTENYAIKNKIKPQKATADNIVVFKKQMRALGLSFDWDREVNTTDPEYYRWTQWIFLQFYKHAIVDNKLVEVADDDTATPRLAYQAEMAINWCPSCKIGLANEEVIAGKCERCGAEVVKKMQKQWMLRITTYAERLIKDLDVVDYLDKIKTQQVNWIGRSTGTNIKFKIVIPNSSDVIPVKTGIHESTILDPRVKPEDDKGGVIEVFTTRADTLFGCTYLVLSPEHKEIRNLKSEIRNYKEVEEYIEKSKKKSDLERTELQKEKTGVELKGIKAINPINNEEVSVWVADYVLASYGTGAVMAVPAHDDRDFEFAKKYNITIKHVIMPILQDTINPPREGKKNTKRNVAMCVIRHPSDGTFLTIKWNKLPWHNFVTGGIEDGEEIIDAAIREIKDETGYKNIKFLCKMPIVINSHFYAAHKDLNRDVTMNILEFQLDNIEQEKHNRESYEDFEPVWVKESELVNLKPLVELPFILRWLDEGDYAFCDYGVLTDSDEFTGLTSEEGNKKITEKLKELGAGDFTVNYKLRDWIFSRQHYWGEPIPIIHCSKCGMIPVPENELPLTLPEVENYEPTNTGQSPLAGIDSWVNVECPKCNGSAKRETDTMPNWAGSSWYFLAYPLKNTSIKYQVSSIKQGSNIFADNQDKLAYWLPVDLYNGGMEHTTLHLLYSRFWHKFLYDLKKVPTSEPYKKRIAHGIILGTDGRKMSKSFGNVISPDDIIKKFGADTTRAYIMFIGPYDQESAWSMAGVQGVFRFLNRVYNNFNKVKENHTDSKELLIKLNQSIAGVTDDLENFRLNTVVSKLMELNNKIESEGAISKESYEKFILLLYPVAPHLASELWEMNGGKSEIEKASWPIADKNYLVADEIEIVVQINGKVRDRIFVPNSISDEELKQKALESQKVKELTDGKEIVKVIVVPKKLVSIVIK